MRACKHQQYHQTNSNVENVRTPTICQTLHSLSHFLSLSVSCRHYTPSSNTILIYYIYNKQRFATIFVFCLWCYFANSLHSIWLFAYYLCSIRLYSYREGRANVAQGSTINTFFGRLLGGVGIRQQSVWSLKEMRARSTCIECGASSLCCTLLLKRNCSFLSTLQGFCHRPSPPQLPVSNIAMMFFVLSTHTVNTNNAAGQTEGCHEGRSQEAKGRPKKRRATAIGNIVETSDCESSRHGCQERPGERGLPYKIHQGATAIISTGKYLRSFFTFAKLANSCTKYPFPCTKSSLKGSPNM